MENNNFTFNNNIYLVGFMGTGKSSVAEYIHKVYGMKLAEMDEILVKQAGCSIPVLFQTKGEAFFRDMETQLLKDLAKKKNQIISCGGGAVLKEENIAVMKSSGCIILLTASPETLFKRIGQDENRPVLNGHRDPGGINELLKKRLPFYEKAADFTVSTDNKSIASIGEDVLKAAGIL